MRTLMVKRLESSFFAFKQSLKRLEKATDNMINMFEKDRIFIAPDLNINDLIEKGFTDEQILILIEKKGDNNKEFSASDFTPDFLANLKIDKEKIADLIKRWDKINFDPKMDAFVKELNNKLFDKKYNQSGKLVIFTESTETAKEIEEKLKQNNFTKTLTIDSSNRKDKEAAIRKNFDANLEESEWEKKDEDIFDIIITTEVLAEGINLHRSNIIVNYDVPWNATRLMQRIGRVNRIGTKADEIFVFNFYPSVQGDNQIGV